MILPTKHLSMHRSLLSVGGRILASLREDQTVSALWSDLKHHSSLVSDSDQIEISFDWFVLALDFLFIAGTVEFHGGMIRRKGP